MITPTLSEVQTAYDECLVYFKSPEAIKTSLRALKSGGTAESFSDIDPLLNDPLGCRHATLLCVERLERLARKQRVDCFASIEKAGGGTVGAIRISGAISMYSGIPNIVIRPNKKLVTEQVKLPPVEGRSGKEQLQGARVIIVTDHTTTGTEILKAAKAIEENGGKVTDVFSFTAMLGEVRQQDIEAQGINLHILY